MHFLENPFVIKLYISYPGASYATRRMAKGLVFSQEAGLGFIFVKP